MKIYMKKITFSEFVSEMSMAARLVLEKIVAAAAAFFSEDIEKLHEFSEISVFTNETP